MVRGNHAVAAVLILALIVAFVVLLVNDKPKWAAGTGATLVLVGLGAAYTQRAAIVRMFGGGVAVLGGGGNVRRAEWRISRARRGKPVAPESGGESDISLSSEEDSESDVSLTSDDDDDDDRPLKFRRTTHQKRW